MFYPTVSAPQLRASAPETARAALRRAWLDALPAAGVNGVLEAAKLVSDESLTLLAGSARLGHKLTAKEKLRRELKAERAGITLPGTEDSRLHKREKQTADDDDDDDADDEWRERTG